MGRRKLNMEIISNEKARYVTYEKRKRGLKKKAYELKTLCDVEVCLIIYEPKVEGRPTEVDIWPPNPNDIQRLIESYKNQSGRRRSLDLSDFFEDRNQKIEGSLAKLRKKNNEAMYSTWDDRYDSLSIEQLRDFEVMLEIKLADVKARVEFMKGSQVVAAPETGSMEMRVIHEQQQPVTMITQNPGEVDLPMIQYPYSQTHLDANSMGYSQTHIDANSMGMSNSHYSTQLGGMSSGNFLYNAQVGRPNMYFDPMMPWMLENMNMNMNINHPSLPMMGYCSTSMQTMSPYLQYFTSPQVPPFVMEEYYKSGDMI